MSKELAHALSPHAPPANLPYLRTLSCLQVHGQHPLEHVVEVMSRERETRSRVGLFGEHKGEGGAAADGAAQ